MVNRSPGPFDYYNEIHPGVTGDSIRAEAHNLDPHNRTLTALAEELDEDGRRITQRLSGALTQDVCLNSQTASAAARDLAGKGEFAAALIRMFGGMVDAFDITVDSLNVRYRTDLASALRWEGQAAKATPDKEDDATVDEAHLGPSIRKNLKGDYLAAVAKLDSDADLVGTAFTQGPTTENVRTLVRSGLFPLASAWLFPNMKIDSTDRWYYYQSIGVPDPEAGPPPEDEDESPPWWKSALSSLGDGAAWTYNHSVVPVVNGAANFGQAMIENPWDLFATGAGVGLMVLGAGGEVGGVALDATGVGAVAGVPINVAAAGVITAGAALAGAGVADLASEAAKNNNTVLNEAHGPSAGKPKPGDPLPESSRPSASGGNWKGRVSDNGKGEVWQDPSKVNAPKGSPRNANSLRIMGRDADPRYPDGYVRFYNEEGQPIDLKGKPVHDDSTHIPRNPDGSFPLPEGWNP